MTGERPDDARDPDGTSGPADGADDREAQRAPAPDAPFHGLRSAADIFGAPRGADDWPSRRERREAEKTARETTSLETGVRLTGFQVRLGCISPARCAEGARRT